MRRILKVFVTLAVVAGALFLVLGRHGSTSTSAERVDVIFRDARGLVPGQLVKVAGAKVGKIEEVKLTPKYEARVELTVDKRFAPFRRDARCAIRPEGLIAENFVECDPGTRDEPPLAARDGNPPTVPSSRTSEPVNITDLFNIFNAPTRQRFSIIVNELGISTAGRGDDINAIIRRAVPAFSKTFEALTIINGQRRQLATVIEQSDELVGKLAARRGRAQEFVTRAARVTDRIADHRDNLSAAVRRLPPLLRETRTTLRSLDAVTASVTPLLRSLRAAAPDLNRVSDDIPALARAAPAAQRSLGGSLTQGTATSRRLAPVVRTLSSYAKASLPGALQSGKLYASLRDSGFIESLLSLFYYGAAATARFDSVSHIAPAHVIFRSECLPYATTPVEGCSANYGKAPATARARRRATRAPRTTPAAPLPAAAAPLPGLIAAPAAPAGAAAAPGKALAVPDVAPVRGILDFLLGP